MSAPILPTKTAVPPVSEAYLPRPRLHALWDRWRELPLALVTAGAGYGKTSLLAACAREGGRPVSWLALDPHDRDPALFVPHLLHAVRPGLEREAAAWDPAASGYGARAVAAAVGELHRAADGRALILDDVHALPPDGPVPEMLDRLARYLPAGVTLVLASREPPTLPTAGRRAAGRAATLTARDLALDHDERLAAAARLGVADPAALTPWLDRTEGWPAGVAILCQGLRDGTALPDRAPPDRAGWFAYFAEEVLAGLDADLRGFVIRASALPRLEPDLCDEILRRQDSRRLLAALHRRELFTIRLDGATPAYRFHHLFHDVLAERLAREPAAPVRALHRRVAAALTRRGRWSDALAAAAAAADHRAVVELLRRHAAPILADGRFELLRQSLDAVPPAVLNREPEALAALGRACEALGDWPAAGRRYRAAIRACGQPRRRAELREAAARLLLREGRHRACAAMTARALAESPRLPRPLRGRLHTIEGIAACDAGRLDKAEAALAAARRDLGPDPDPDEAVRTTFLLESNIHFRRGDLARAREAVRRALGAYRRAGDAPMTCHGLGVLAHLTAESADEPAARELALTCLRQAESLEYHLMEGYAHLALARCDMLADDPVRARRHADRAAALGEEVGEVGLRGLPRLQLATLAAAAGARHEAAALAADVLARARTAHDPYLEVQTRALLSRLLADAEPAAARDHRRRALRLAVRVGMALEEHRLRLHDPAEDPSALLLELLRAGHGFVAEKEEPRAALDLAERALAQGDPPAEVRALARRLAEAHPRLVSGRTHPHVTSDLPDGRPAAAAAPARGDALGIQALGPFVVRRGDRELRLDHWRSARALRLFQLLLVHRFRWVPRDVVLETLWPDTRPDLGGNSLRQTLHVLRRTLQETLGLDDPAATVLHRRDALRLDPGEDGAYDVLDLEAALTDAETAWSAGRRDRAEASVRHALDIGQGPFLAESPYEEFAAVEREHLRDRRRRNLARLLDDLADADRWDDLVPLARRAVDLDAWSEDAHHHLVRALAALGHRAEALAAYRTYETVMVRELDLLPSPRLRALAEGLA